jgi:hypothetical protein
MRKMAACRKQVKLSIVVNQHHCDAAVGQSLNT